MNGWRRADADDGVGWVLEMAINGAHQMDAFNVVLNQSKRNSTCRYPHKHNDIIHIQAMFDR
jgi:hypothetical protein